MSTTTQTQPKGKQCTRCGHTIFWNNNSGFFEDEKYPKFQHCCPLPCNKEGCGGTIYFSNICPKNTQTGRAIPLDVPIPVVNPNDPAKMMWVVHVHKTTIPAEQSTTAPAAPIAQLPPELKAIQNPTPAPAGQATLEYTPTVEDTKKVVQKVMESTIDAGMTGSTGNPGVDASLVGAIQANTQAVSDMNARLAKIEEFMNECVLPEYRDFHNYWTLAKPKLDILVGKIAEGSIKSAADLIEYHQQSEQQERNLQ